MTTRTPEQLEERKQKIARDAEERYGIVPQEHEWATDDYGDIYARLPDWEMVQEDEDKGHFVGDTGTIVVSVVGAPEHGNERVTYLWLGEDMEEPHGEVIPFETVEQRGD